MREPRSSILAVATLAAAHACGGDVVVDGTPTAAGSGGAPTATAHDVASSAANSANSVSSSGAATSAVTSGNGGSFASAESATSSGITVDPCFMCACEVPLAAGGCAEICTAGLSGMKTLDFCNGVPALAQCTACIAQHCGSTPAACH